MVREWNRFDTSKMLLCGLRGLGPCVAGAPLRGARPKAKRRNSASIVCFASLRDAKQTIDAQG
jgi:hypothetical protein